MKASSRISGRNPGVFQKNLRENLREILEGIITRRFLGKSWKKEVILEEFMKESSKNPVGSIQRKKKYLKI